MLKYLKDYNWPDMLTVIRNGKQPPLASTERMDGKLCIVTGATSGVGLEAASRLYAAGADILMINRNQEKSEALCAQLRAQGAAAGTGFGTVEYHLADFSRLVDVCETIAFLQSLQRPIDVLINNAGVFNTKRQLTVDGLETVFMVNHLASFMITKALLPRFRQQGFGRIIQVNSQGHRFFGLRLDDLNWQKRPYSGLKAYGAAKTAQLLCCYEFADRLRDTAVTINAMHPGAVKSNVGNNNGRFYRWYNRTFVWKTLAETELSGIALHYLAAAPELTGLSGRYFNLTTEEKPAPHALDRELGRRIWDVSCQLSGLPD